MVTIEGRDAGSVVGDTTAAAAPAPTPGIRIDKPLTSDDVERVVADVTASSGSDPLELFNAFIEAFAALGVDFAAGDELAEERIARLSAELSDGSRTLVDVIGSLLGSDVFGDLGIEGKTGADADRIAGELEGGRTIADLIGSFDRISTRDLIAGEADNPIPAGAKLIRITDPSGSDATVRYVVAYDVLGVQISYDIGDLDDFLELFPSGERAFASVETFSQGQFDDLGIVEVGAVDELLGRTESLTSEFQRELTALGSEGLASWMANDPDVLIKLALASNEDWSSRRLWSELSSTQGFTDRFGAFDTFAVAGETIETTVARYLDAEEQLVGALLEFRPTGFTITTDYLAKVLNAGWDASEVAAVLEAEKIIRDNPESLTQFNAILLASGLPSQDEAGLIEAIAGAADLDVIEALNTAAAGLALRAAGLEDVDIELLVDVIDDVSGLRTPEDFAEVAQRLAFEFARNRFELDTGKLGLDQDDVFATILGGAPPSGRTTGEVFNTLLKFEKERAAAATGFGGAQAFVNARGNLQIAGFSGA